MAKEIMAITPEDIRAHIALTASAADTLKWLIAHAGIEMDEEAKADFVAKRNVRANEIRDIWELKAWCEKTAACIKEVCKHAFNVTDDPDDLPPNVKFSKQSYTYEFAEGAGHIVADDLEAHGLVTKEKILDSVPPTTLAKLAGLTTDKLVEKYGDVVLAKPKERTLTIK